MIDDHLSYPPPDEHEPGPQDEDEVLLPEVLPPEEPQLPSTTYSFQLPEGNAPEAIRVRIKLLKQITERCYMRLGRDLWECFQRKLYVDYGYDTFDDYVATEVGISRDRSYKLRRIFSVLVLKCNIPPKIVERAERTRVEMILGVVTRDNAEEWLKQATTLDYKELRNRLSQERARRDGITPTATKPDKPETTTPVRIACESPRGDAGSNETDFQIRTFRLPKDADTLLTEGLGVAQRVTGSHSDNFNLTCIVQQFLAHSLTLEGKDDGRAGFFTRWMEEIYGGHFLHIKDEKAWDVLRKAIESPENSNLLGTGKREDRNGRYDSGREEEEEES